MRRLGLTWVVALALSTTLFAAGNQPTTEKWSGKVNVARLSRFLDLSSAQYDNVEKICLYFNEQMERANNSRKHQDKYMREAVYGNLKLMKHELTDKQYNEYVRLLNVTLQNKGIEVK